MGVKCMLVGKKYDISAQATGIRTSRRHQQHHTTHTHTLAHPHFRGEGEVEASTMKHKKKND
jgi:hypothetical protein